MSRSRYSPERESHADLRAQIDAAARESSTVLELMRVLKSRGVDAVPSLNSRGINGMAYVWKGERVLGSDVGRSYTAAGLQSRKGLKYDPDRDLAELRRMVERGNDRPVAQEQPRAAASNDNTGNDIVPASDPRDEPGRKGRSPERPKEREFDPRRRDIDTGFSHDQRTTLMEIGKYRMIDRGDLLRLRYEGHAMRMKTDMAALTYSGYVEHKQEFDPRHHDPDVYVLTKEGQKAAYRFSKASTVDGANKQRFHHGFVKPAEMAHDAGIYRMGMHARRQIEAEGGRVVRVVLDYELKKEFWRQLNSGRTAKGHYHTQDYRDRKQKVAQDLGLAIVDGHVVLPDLRLEYRDKDGELQHKDLELASSDYKKAHIETKRRAGLQIYRPDARLGGTPWSETEYEYAR